MTIKKWFQHPKKRIVLFLLSCTLFIGIASTQAFAQTTALGQKSSAINGLCRQVNAKTLNGAIAYYAPGGSFMKTPGGSTDGPESNKAVYLTSSPAELSADGKYIRVWFKSIEPNYKLGWISTKLQDGDDMLKMGNSLWRAKECTE